MSDRDQFLSNQSLHEAKMQAMQSAAWQQKVQGEMQATRLPPPAHGPNGFSDEPAHHRAVAATNERLDRAVSDLRRIRNRIHGPAPESVTGCPTSGGLSPAPSLEERMKRQGNLLDQLTDLVGQIAEVI